MSTNKDVITRRCISWQDEAEYQATKAAFSLSRDRLHDSLKYQFNASIAHSTAWQLLARLIGAAS